MTNYKKKYGITLKEAKQIAKNNNGKLPKPGYMAFIKSEECKIKSSMYPDISFLGFKKIYLVNNAGKFYLTHHIS